MLSIVTVKQNEIAAACRKRRVQRLELFGSAVGNATAFTKDSDLDFAVEFASQDSSAPLAQYMDFRADLEHILGHPVDLVEAKAVRNPFVRRAIERQRELVFAA